MDITKDRFQFEAVRIIQEIADSHFVAIDLEFSGVAGRSHRRLPGKPFIQEVYEETKAAAEKYQVLQIGLTIVKEDVRKGQYVLLPYNFNINPLPTLGERYFKRDWTMNSGAVSFLLRNQFNFGLPLTHGVPYLSRTEEIVARTALKGERDEKRPDMDLKPEDDVLIKHIRLSIHQWMEQPKAQRDSYLNIPAEDRSKGVPGSLNNYQMRLTHQIVQNEFPSMKTTSGYNFVQITDPTHEESIAQQRAIDERVERDLSNAIGFRWLLEALVGGDISKIPSQYVRPHIPHESKSEPSTSQLEKLISDLNDKLKRRRKILVGHNCFTDLIYLHRFFIGELPATVEDFRDSVRGLFPAVIDTKTMASSGNNRWRDTSLQRVEMDLRDDIPSPRIFIPPEFDRYNNNDMQHEAGYDSLLTAKIAVRLSAKMERLGTYLEENADSRPSSPVSMRFGEQEGYITAQQSPSNSDIGDKSQLVNNHSNFEASDDAATLPDAGASLVANENPVLSNSPVELVAIKGMVPSPSDFKKPLEVEKIRSAFASSTIYDVLDGNDEQAQASGYDADNDADSDLMSFSDDDSSQQIKTPDTDRKAKAMDKMMKQGKLMPRWDGGNGYWRIFGNKLQVNSSKEGSLRL